MQVSSLSSSLFLIVETHLAVRQGFLTLRKIVYLSVLVPAVLLLILSLLELSFDDIEFAEAHISDGILSRLRVIHADPHQ